VALWPARQTLARRPETARRRRPRRNSRRAEGDLERASRALPVQQPNDSDQESRNNNLSRAYRVNLTVLALVALFTGAFLVFSTQALSVMRRRSQFALLRVLGVERGQLLRQVLVEGASLGVIGALLGIAAGYALAALALRFFGGDLGAGYFPGISRKSFHAGRRLRLLRAGPGRGPARLPGAGLEAARAKPAVALKSGNDEAALSRLARIWPSLICLALAAPVRLRAARVRAALFGYFAIALLLIGGIGLMPRLAASLPPARTGRFCACRTRRRCWR
jgi:putative ABC transport system permease protein